MITNPIKPLIVKQILIVSTLQEDHFRNHIIFTSFIKRQLLLSLNYRILRFQDVTFNHFKFSAKVIGYSLLWLHWNEVQLFVLLCHHFQSGLRCFNLKLQALNLQASWGRLSVCSQNLTIHIWSDYITRQKNSTSVPVRVYDFTLLNHQAYTGNYSAITNTPCFKQML